ncbi:hypothetical protein ACFFTM_21415 [Pseudoduganella plicata]|uniref:Protein phosphatase 2C domain-containing protein n=1 Tax=Pseudoduganella plicata TaxID=321984 RepID=A0A4P7BI74_9BURK|nr:hypothetical protein [Pseudoduganella plicata]QBQ38070.1 hypothetical protein E1742_19175 [Pseudoduganella plicata]GGZ03247.1 hypothetical protein GCM10007388_41100 [Pseudoduganella plicata]
MDNAPRGVRPQLTIDTVCDGATATHNEDLIAVFGQDDLTDILVLDGGTSVAEMDHIDAEQGDVVWFVRTFCRLLEPHLRRDRSQGDSVRLALAKTHAAFLDRIGGADVPLHAWPIAALSWLRIVHTEETTTLQAWCVGDCKTLLFDGDASIQDIDPHVNPQEAILQAQLKQLADDGIVDAVARKAHLLPMLRARREEQNTASQPSVLCLAPRGPIVARTFTMPLAPGAVILGMTDGFYRLVDPYRLLTAGELARRCAVMGLAPMLAQLRTFEADQSRSHSLAVKGADDAAAVLCRVLPGSDNPP